MTKYLFLDIDGVLNTRRNLNRLSEKGKPCRDRYGWLFDDIAVHNLKKALEETGAKVVVSSTWRIYGSGYIQKMWKDRHLPDVPFGSTPSLVSTKFHTNNSLNKEDEEEWEPFIPRGKGLEVAAWLDKYAKRDDRYVIVDDEEKEFFIHQQPHLVVTDGEVGITEENYRQIVKILNQ